MLAELLRELRGSRRVEDVASALRVSRAAVYFWESSSRVKRLPSAAKLQRLLDLYDAAPEQRLRAWAYRGHEEAKVEGAT
jgi:transcriptional regulator with XRE-family HTH domain